MSILNDLLTRKITFNQAATETAAWFQHLSANAPPAVLQDLGQAESAMKQGLSNAIALGDTQLGPFLATATPVIETAVVGFLNGATKGINAPLSAAEDAGISLGIQALHTLIDELATQVRAKYLAPAPQVVPASVQHLPS